MWQVVEARRREAVAPISPEGPQGTEARVLTGEEAWPVPLAPRDCKIAGKRRALAIPEPSLRCGIDGRARSLATGGASTPWAPSALMAGGASDLCHLIHRCE